MRQIKFRGKRTDNGEWVYGSYHCCIGPGSMTFTAFVNGNRVLEDRAADFNNHWILVQRTPSDPGWDIRDTYTPHEVIPETVGQFTGLLDKDGKEIYEGDICRHFWNPILNEPSELFEADLPVSYYTGWGCFVFHWQSKKMKKKQRELFEDYGRQEVYVAIGSPIMYGQGVEVIGNIYENPELLQP